MPSLLVVLALAAVAVPPAAARTVPWGGGCEQPVSGKPRTSATCGARLVDGQAVPPPGAPAVVKRVIGAANEIYGKPYIWGGGHASWEDRGYDCSGAVGYALHGGGLVGTTMVSGELAYWGSSGLGRWITVYANAEHVYMVVAGLRFDTRDAPLGVTGPRWHRASADTRPFVARHPLGL